MAKKIINLLILLTLLTIPLSKASAVTFAEKFAGRILLQVESKGEAWYVSPVNQKRYFLGRPADAFRIIRGLGLGVNNANFQKFEKNLPAKYLGRIFIKTEDKGKAYYANPLDKKLYYLGRPSDAFSLMRRFGLGIKNSDLSKISEDPSSITERKRQGTTVVIKITTPESEPVTPPSTGNNPVSTSSEPAVIPEPVATSTETTATTSVDQTASTSLSMSCEFLAEYFKNETVTGASVYQEKEFGLNHDWGISAPSLLGDFKDKFSARFTGACYFAAGTYEFTTTYDDGVRATVDDNWLANSWKNNNALKTDTVTLDLSEGIHNVIVRYYDHLGNAVIKLDWKKIK